MGDLYFLSACSAIKIMAEVKIIVMAVMPIDCQGVPGATARADEDDEVDPLMTMAFTFAGSVLPALSDDR